jgi:hypothetical protein
MLIVRLMRVLVPSDDQTTHHSNDHTNVSVCPICLFAFFIFISFRLFCFVLFCSVLLNYVI